MWLWALLGGCLLILKFKVMDYYQSCQFHEKPRCGISCLHREYRSRGDFSYYTNIDRDTCRQAHTHTHTRTHTPSGLLESVQHDLQNTTCATILFLKQTTSWSWIKDFNWAFSQFLSSDKGWKHEFQRKEIKREVKVRTRDFMQIWCKLWESNLV